MKILLDIILSFGKIGFTALGGGNSMLKLIEHEAVINRHWILPQDFVTIVGSTFLFPGLTAVKISAIIGYKIAGPPGMILAVSSLNLPGLLMALVGFSSLTQSDSLIAKKLLVIVQYGALALLAAAAFSVAEGVIQNYYSISLIFLSTLFFLSLALWDLSPFWGFLIFIGVALLV